MAPKKIEDLLREKKISEIINPRLIQASPSISVRNAIALMRKNRSGYVVIAEKNKVRGIFTETEVVQKILGRDVNWDRPASEFMNPEPYCLNPEDSVGEAVDNMAQARVYHLPLINRERELVGVISVRTLIRFLAEFYPSEVYNLPPNTDQIMKSPEGG